ncbi:CARDB domain-containing protein [Aureisphaera galaxeae]|uniref:T9SS type B sorting domain-containing protein n=1 Tax=Aureisphaera galaxeae TaxID=1538023 RepID=UPI002350A9D9|nr:gliding motility-associated C-terminal domain-containing protein [Aureisphaera galaxeae]MDC8003419.1 CARDB domain-containing protein [Aureisphaera galaxeae]
MNLIKKLILPVLLLLPVLVYSQEEVVLFQQFEGRYTYLSFGNTLNTGENTGGTTDCEILEESSADYFLETDQTMIAAYIYWGGSGTGDTEVALNGTPITAERTFAYDLDGTHMYAGGYADITALIASTGNGTYTFSEFTPDITPDVYCAFPGNTTNFGGWAVTIVFEDPDLPLNQVSIFDGFESVSAQNPSLDIQLTDLEVVDNAEAKIGFLAWEGDEILANNETLRLNGTLLSNPLNPADNAFNGTNTFTGSSDLYNMDIDQYSVENLIQPGDTEALIELTSNQDLVIVQNIVTVLNVALPEATISIDNIVGGTECGNRELTIDYTVFNTNGTDRLPPAEVAFFGDNVLMAETMTTAIINFGESESESITFTVPDGIPSDFLLRAFVDPFDEINELDDDNNEDNTEFHLLVFPDVGTLQDLELCDVVGTELFDLTEATTSIDPEDTLSYHPTQADAENNTNPIEGDITAYENTSNPETIWIRVSNPDCFVTDSFEVEVIVCPLPDATVSIDNQIYACRLRDLVVEYTVYNTEGTDDLPAGTNVAFYADLQLIAQTQTLNVIPIGGSESGSFEVTLPESLPNNFVLAAVVDDDGTGLGTVEELNEFNNEFDLAIEFGTIPPITQLPTLTECDKGFEMAFFDLTAQDELITQNTAGEFNYFLTQEDATANVNPITDPAQFENTSNPQMIYVRLENEICFTTSSFQLVVEQCPPIIYEGISPNGDTLNDVLHMDYVVNVFPNFNLKIYSREGNLIYEGGNDEGEWDAIPNTGILYQDKFVPVGTYYYVLVLNHPNFPEPYIGDVYVNY